MIKENLFFDFREERHAGLFRAWILISLLDKNKNNDCVLTIEKAAIIDFILKNPSLLSKAQTYLGKHSSSVGDILYNTNLQHGNAYKHKSFLATTLLLEHMGLVSLQKTGIEYFVRCETTPPDITDELYLELKSQILAIKGLVPKSISILTKHILGE
jgi:hypothetical protein